MKTILFYAIALLLFSYFSTEAQDTAIVVWQHSFGTSTDDEARCMIATNDGGFLLAGYESAKAGVTDGDVNSGHGSADYWLIKIDASSNLLWNKTYGGSQSDMARSVIQTSDGGYIIAGQAASSDGDVTGNHGSYDFWIVKTDVSGNIQWQKTYGGSQEENAYCIQQTTDGGYIIAGYTYSQSGNGDISYSHGGEDIWIIKIDASGKLLWQKTYGGTGREEAASIHQTTDGGYIVGAWSSSNDGDVTGNHGDFDFWVLKLTNNGDITWQKSLGGSKEDGAREARQTTDGGYIVAGYTFSKDGDVTKNHGKRDYWLVKLDSAGTLKWQKTYGGNGDDYGYYVQQVSDGGYLLTGYTATLNNGDVSGNHGNHDYWSIKTDASGNLLWQKSSGGTLDDGARNILPTSDGGYVISGYAKSHDKECPVNKGLYDVWVQKFTFNQLPKKSLQLMTYGEISSQKQASTLNTMDQNFPNPFRQCTTIRFSIPGNFTKAEIQVVDMNGKVFADIPIHAAGEGQVQINGRDFTNGYYIYTLIVDGKISGTGKMYCQK